MMELKIVQKDAFSVIGKQGSTQDGEDFIARLWQAANEAFPEVADLAKKEPDGSFAGFWGLMSDEGMHFAPWEDDFSRGLYLAGVESEGDAVPEGWVKWTAPAAEYAVSAGDFREVLAELEKQGFSLAGAIYDFTDPRTGENTQYFPIRRLP